MSKEDLIEKTNEAISQLVKPKVELLKAYNYYDGIRDAEQFRFLEENYGLGNPTSIHFTPLVKKHIDALIGEFLGTPILPKISCKDSETLNNIERDKLLYIKKNIYLFLLSKLKNSILNFLNNLLTTDQNIQQQLDKIVEDLDTNFISEYEIAALNVVEYIILNRDTNMITNLRYLLLDLLIAGYCLFRCKETDNKENVSIEVLDPRNTFIDRNPESVFIKNSYRAVVRKWLSKDEILSKYGKLLSKEDKKLIEKEWDENNHYGEYYISAKIGDSFPKRDTGLDYGVDVTEGPYFNNRPEYTKSDLIPVYEVEWIETDKNFVMNRYSTIRIGEEIFILIGKDDTVIRTKNNPNSCTLTINGIYFTNRTPKPYSLMMACSHLLDKYDMLMFIRDTIIANSGSVGDYIDMSMLPTWLGTGPAERLQKYIAYKKLGIAPIDTAQEGRLATGQAPINTIFNGYDDTVKTLAIQAIQLAIESIELTVCSITGVFKERLNGIELRDAVTNVKQGALNSYIITKQYYQLMDLVISELLYDSLNIAKSVWKNGLTGTIVLGENKLKIFTALPEHFTLTDFDVRVINTADIIKDLETIKLLIPDLIKSGLVGADVLLDILNCKSLTEATVKVKLSIKKLKEENNQLLLLQQLTEQLQLQLQQTQQELQKALQQVQQLNAQKLLIEQLKVNIEGKLGWYQAQTDRTYKTKEAEIDEKKVQVEIALLTDGNPYNDKINFSK